MAGAKLKMFENLSSKALLMTERGIDNLLATAKIQKVCFSKFTNRGKAAFPVLGAHSNLDPKFNVLPAQPSHYNNAILIVITFIIDNHILLYYYLKCGIKFPLITEL